MYTDPVNPNHALVEVIDNASDEGLAGYAKKCGDQNFMRMVSAEVIDDGRGIPVDIHRTKKIPAIQVIFYDVCTQVEKFRKNRF